MSGRPVEANAAISASRNPRPLIGGPDEARLVEQGGVIFRSFGRICLDDGQLREQGGARCPGVRRTAVS